MAAAVVLAVASLAACLSASYAGPTRLTMNGVRVCLPWAPLLGEDLAKAPPLANDLSCTYK